MPSPAREMMESFAGLQALPTFSKLPPSRLISPSPHANLSSPCKIAIHLSSLVLILLCSSISSVFPSYNPEPKQRYGLFTLQR